MKSEFFIPMIPPTVTHQAKDLHAYMKDGKPRAVIHDSEELKAARSKLQSHLYGQRPSVPAVGAVRLTVKWLFPRGEDHADGEYRITKPDTDNLEKMLKDVMTDLNFWKDDAQVCSEICEKFWAEKPGIWIRMEEL